VTWVSTLVLLSPLHIFVWCYRLHFLQQNLGGALGDFVSRKTVKTEEILLSYLLMVNNSVTLMGCVRLFTKHTCLWSLIMTLVIL